MQVGQKEGRILLFEARLTIFLFYFSVFAQARKCTVTSVL